MPLAHRPSNAARLLKTLVVVGASLGASGCGGGSRRSVSDGSGGKGPASGAGGVGATGGMPAAGAPAGGATGNVEACPYSAQRACSCRYQPAINLSCTLNYPYSD